MKFFSFEQMQAESLGLHFMFARRLVWAGRAQRGRESARATAGAGCASTAAIGDGDLDEVGGLLVGSALAMGRRPGTIVRARATRSSNRARRFMVVVGVRSALAAVYCSEGAVGGFFVRLLTYPLTTARVSHSLIPKCDRSRSIAVFEDIMLSLVAMERMKENVFDLVAFGSATRKQCLPKAVLAALECAKPRILHQ